MSAASKEPSLYEAAWNQFVIELRDYASDAVDWMTNLSAGHQILGLCAFAMVLMFLIVNASRRKADPGSNGRQFTGAILIIVIMAFGVGWTFDGGTGSLSHLFQR